MCIIFLERGRVFCKLHVYYLLLFFVSSHIIRGTDFCDFVPAVHIPSCIVHSLDSQSRVSCIHMTVDG